MEKRADGIGMKLNGESLRSGSIRAATTAPLNRLPSALLLCDSNIQNRLLQRWLREAGVCRARLAAPSQLAALAECERPTLILLDIRSSDRAVADLLAASPADGRQTAPMVLLNMPSSVDPERFSSRKDIAAIFHDDEPVDDLMNRIRQVLSLDGDGAPHNGAMTQPGEALTRKEMAVLRSLALGLSNDHIADQLSVSPHTVKTHLYNAYRKIGCTNRVAAAMWAQRTLGQTFL